VGLEVNEECNEQVSARGAKALSRTSRGSPSSTHRCTTAEARAGWASGELHHTVLPSIADGMHDRSGSIMCSAVVRSSASPGNSCRTGRSTTPPRTAKQRRSIRGRVVPHTSRISSITPESRQMQRGRRASAQLTNNLHFVICPRSPQRCTQRRCISWRYMR
jgi:hypothetical protein